MSIPKTCCLESLGNDRNDGDDEAEGEVRPREGGEEVFVMAAAAAGPDNKAAAARQVMGGSISRGSIGRGGGIDRLRRQDDAVAGGLAFLRPPELPAGASSEGRRLLPAKNGHQERHGPSASSPGSSRELCTAELRNQGPGFKAAYCAFPLPAPHSLLDASAFAPLGMGLLSIPEQHDDEEDGKDGRKADEPRPGILQLGAESSRGNTAMSSLDVRPSIIRGASTEQVEYPALTPAGMVLRYLMQRDVHR